MSASITKRAIADADRADFLPRHVPGFYLEFETLCFSIMGKACEGYTGGLWEFFDLSNGAFFMCPWQDAPMRLRWEENYFEGEMSAEAWSSPSFVDTF